MYVCVCVCACVVYVRVYDSLGKSCIIFISFKQFGLTRDTCSNYINNYIMYMRVHVVFIRSFTRVNTTPSIIVHKTLKIYACNISKLYYSFKKRFDYLFI